MVFVWGTRRIEKPLGYVADFCPICRGIRCFKLTSIRSVSHVYFISVSGAKLRGHVLQCRTCGTVASADVSRFRTPVRNPEMGMDDMIEATFPRLREEYAHRLALEDCVRTRLSALRPLEREELITEPFIALAPRVEAMFNGGNAVDRLTALGCLGTLVAPILLVTVVTTLRPGAQSDWALTTAIGLFFAGFLYTLIQNGLIPYRRVGSDVIPTLARTLSLLQPRRDEIQGVLSRLKAQDLAVGKRVRADRLMQALDLEIRDGGRSPVADR